MIIIAILWGIKYMKKVMLVTENIDGTITINDRICFQCLGSGLLDVDENYNRYIEAGFKPGYDGRNTIECPTCEGTGENNERN